MIKVQHSVVINRPAPEVFVFITDPANQHKWQDGVTAASISSGGALGVGAEITETRKFLGRDMNSILKLTQFEQNKMFVGKVMEGPIKFEVSQQFEAVDGGTKVTVHIEGDPGGFFKLAEGMVRKQLETQMAADFERAKKLLEG